MIAKISVIVIPNKYAHKRIATVPYWQLYLQLYLQVRLQLHM